MPWAVGVGPNKRARERAARLAIVLAFSLHHSSGDSSKKKLMDIVQPAYGDIKPPAVPGSVVIPPTDDLAPTWA